MYANNLEPAINHAVESNGHVSHLPEIANHAWNFVDFLRSRALYPSPLLPESTGESVRRLRENIELLEELRGKFEKRLEENSQALTARALDNAFATEASSIATSRRLWIAALVALNVGAFAISAFSSMPSGDEVMPWLAFHLTCAAPIAVLDWLIIRQCGALATLERSYRFKATVARAIPSYTSTINSKANLDRGVEYLISTSREVLFAPPSDGTTHSPVDDAATLISSLRPK